METLIAVLDTPLVSFLFGLVIIALSVLYVFKAPAGSAENIEPEDHAGQLLDEYFADLDQARQDNALIQRWQHFGEAGDW